MKVRDRLTPIVIVLLLAAGCSPRDASGLDRSRIRASIESAIAIDDPADDQRDDPAEDPPGDTPGRAAIDNALREALRESARIDARLRWWPFVERTDLAAWSRVAHLAARRARVLRARHAALEEEWRLALTRAEGSLEEASRLLVSPPARRTAQDLRTATSQLELARTLARERRLADAIDAAGRSIDASLVTLRERDRQLARFEDPSNLRHWTSWTDETIRASARRREAAIIVDKLARKLHLYDSGSLEATFDVELGSGALARKLYQGDAATPEGQYHVREIRSPGATRYHRALLIDYPTADDWRRFRAARARGDLSARARIGGLIEIHGQGGQGRDWTEGCVALSNGDMDQLVRSVRVGTPVTIVGRVP